MVPANSIYRVRPWGHRYQESARHRRGHFDGYPCAICGRDIRGEPTYGGIITIDGEWTTDPNHPRSQGWHPVGSNCHRRFVIKGA